MKETKKKLRAVLFLLLAAAFTTQAQTGKLTEPVCPDQITRMISREFGYPNVVSYIEYASNKSFVITDGVSSKTMAWPSSLEVRDFEVSEGNTVYCCGVNIGNHRGFVCWFNISDMGNIFSNGFYRDLFRSSAGQEVTVFDKLDISLNPQTRNMHIACLGESNQSQSVVMELSGPVGYSTGWTATIGERDNTNEKMIDIMFLNDYVVTVGVLNDSWDHGVAFRIFEKYRMFNGTLNPNNVYRFPPSSDNWYGYPVAPFVTCGMKGNMVAVASLYRGMQCGRICPVLGTSLDFFDMDTILNDLLGTSGHIYCERIPFQNVLNANVVEMRDIYYDSLSSKLSYLCHTSGWSSTTETYTLENELISPTYLLHFDFLFPGRQFHNIRPFNGTSKWIETGFGTIRHSEYRRLSVGSTIYCPNSVDLRRHIYPLHERKDMSEKFDVNTERFYYDVLLLSKLIKKETSTICEEE